MDTFADDLGAVIDQLDLRDLGLVGHSMGCGEILRYVARHGTSRVSRVAFLAPANPLVLQTADNPNGASKAFWEAAWAAWAKDFPGWVDQNKAPFFTPETSPALADWAVRML